MIENIRNYCERRGFEVCSRLGRKMGIRPSVVRVYFIYTSFFTLGSPFILYLFLAFWIRFKDYIKHDRTSVWEL